MKHGPFISSHLRPRSLAWTAVVTQFALGAFCVAAAEGTTETKAGSEPSVAKTVESTNTVAKSSAAPASGTTTNGVPQGAGRPAAPARLDQASFRIISERNIFNPTRSSRAASMKAEGEPKKVVKIESVSLVGTMSYEKGDFAFFDGSGSDFKKVVKPEETIAGFKVQQISFNQVSLVREGKTMNLAVGDKLRRQDDGPWEVTAATDKSSAESTAASSGASSSDESSSGDGGESEVLKRLLKKREQEMKNEK